MSADRIKTGVWYQNLDCRACEGTGVFFNGTECPHCDGTGKRGVRRLDGPTATELRFRAMQAAHPPREDVSPKRGTEA